MPIYRLPKELVFPPVELAEPDGLLAVGGDLSAGRLLLAYRSGIFPWYMPDEPILWWSPDPRMVLYPANLKVSKSMGQVLRSSRFEVTFDQDFPAVIKACATTERDGSTETWIVPEMIAAYTKLHELGHAHSVEVWRGGALVGGLYGVAMGNIFCGESMFSRESNASKAGFITLVRWLQQKGLYMVDCQTHTPHLESLGAALVPRQRFLAELQQYRGGTIAPGPWVNG